MPATKELTKEETAILEELDAYNRADVRLTVMDFCAVAASEPLALLCGDEIQKMIRVLSRRGLIQNIGRRIFVSPRGRLRIRRSMKVSTSGGTLSLDEKWQTEEDDFKSTAERVDFHDRYA